MRITYAHANPRSGHESYVIKFSDETMGQTSCILVDAGRNVSVDDLLDDDEYLAAVLLTHAHIDHYRSLGAVVRDGAPVYASPATAELLETVLVENTDTYDLPDPTPALEALEGISDWEQVAPGVSVRPIPAGHAPGAVGFVIRFEDGGANRYVLSTGDFSFRRAGGYPEFSTDVPCPIDAMFLNVATTDYRRRDDRNGADDYDYDQVLTDSIVTLLERVQAGSNVLLATSGLTGVKYAYLLDSLADRYGGIDLEPITLVGHVAKLFEDLEYDCPNVETVPVFDDPTTIVDRPGLAIAGPEVPTTGSSRELFRTIRDDPGATLVQVTGGASSPVERASCTVYEYTLIDHPSEDELESVIDDLAPIQLIVEHQRPNSTSFRSNENSFVWEHADHTEYVLYDGSWRPPPWMTAEGKRLVVQNNPRTIDPVSDGGRVDTDDHDPSFPPITRRSTPDYDAEGLLLDRLDERFRSGTESSTSSDTTHSRSGGRSLPDQADAQADPSRSDSGVDDSDSTSSEPEPGSEPETETGTQTEREPPASTADDGSDSESPSETDSGLEPQPALESDPTSEVLTHILHRLDAIESRLSVVEPAVPATVIDAGDDVVLFRPAESELQASLALESRSNDEDGRDHESSLEHGDTVYLTVSTEPPAAVETRPESETRTEAGAETESESESKPGMSVTYSATSETRPNEKPDS